MSFLPQRKKSAEEIAQLRDSLGVPGSSSFNAAPATSESPIPDTPEPAKETNEPLEPVLAKPVRSLRKSEQKPVYVMPAQSQAASSKLPTQRRSSKEIEEMRRREMLAQQQSASQNPRLAKAHPFILLLGYMTCGASASWLYFPESTLDLTASACASSLLIALFIFLRRPLSKHHAGFMAGITLLIVVFGTLHYFPQLLHAP